MRLNIVYKDMKKKITDEACTPVRIGDYELLTELKTKDAGFSKWGFCKRDGRVYFIKEFLKPVFPMDETLFGQELLEHKREECRAFYGKRKAFYEALRQCMTGNIIIGEDFFRSGSRYYLVTEKVESSPIDPVRLTAQQKECLIRSILYSMARLHEAGIVHGDLKPKNLLLKPTRDGFYTAKIIDFDAGFLRGTQPEKDELQVDYSYMAPETFLRLKGKEARLDEKIDIFALGLVFHRYWAGCLPRVDEPQRYVWQAVLNGEEFHLAETIPEDLQEILLRMLARDPEERPGAAQILRLFQERNVLREAKYFYISHALD